MLDILFINNSSEEFDESFTNALREKLSEWQSKKSPVKNCPITLLAKNDYSERVYEFKFEKKIWEKLEDGVEHNLLAASIDMFMQRYPELKKKNIILSICIGFDEGAVKKMVGVDQSKSKKSQLNISPVEPKYSLSQVILPEKTRSEIDAVVTLLNNMNRIYYDWGFSEIDPVPRSIVNLWGPPGTGKTMTVHAISKEMGKKILVLNYADIESKYVGDAPKNLVAAFDLAERENAVIFFDEADSFLGKRITNVDSGSEQAINSLRSQMLMKLEEFKGIVFFATNLHENYDRAFESRILKHIEFTLPDEAARKEIIRVKLPLKAPYDSSVRNGNGEFSEELLDELSKTVAGFSGREIKNCVLESLVKVCCKEPHLVTAEILRSVFAGKKEEADALKQKYEERKKKLGFEVKKNLDGNNYAVKKLDGNVNGEQTAISGGTEEKQEE